MNRRPCPCPLVVCISPSENLLFGQLEQLLRIPYSSVFAK
jgi:hypothetical protein